MPPWVRWLWLTIGVMAVLALAARYASGLLITIAMAGLLAAGLRPIRRALERRGVSRGLAVALIFVGFLAALALVVAAVVPAIAQQVADLVRGLPTYATHVQQWGSRWSDLEERLTWLPSLADMTAWVTARASTYVQAAVGLTGQAVNLVVQAFMVAFLLFYLLKDGGALSEQFLRLVPPYRRESARRLMTHIVDKVGRYTLGTAMDMTLVGLLTAVGLWAVGVPNALALGAIVGAFNLLPFIGATIGAIPGLIVAFTISPRMGFMALAVYVIVQQLEGYVIYPRVVGHAVGLHPIWVLVSLTLGAQVWGVVGVFLGIPAAVVIKSLLEAWVVPTVQRMSPPSQGLVESPGVPSGLPRVVLYPETSDKA